MATVKKLTPAQRFKNWIMSPAPMDEEEARASKGGQLFDMPRGMPQETMPTPPAAATIPKLRMQEVPENYQVPTFSNKDVESFKNIPSAFGSMQGGPISERRGGLTVVPPFDPEAYKKEQLVARIKKWQDMPLEEGEVRGPMPGSEAERLRAGPEFLTIGQEGGHGLFSNEYRDRRNARVGAEAAADIARVRAKNAVASLPRSQRVKALAAMFGDISEQERQVGEGTQEEFVTIPAALRKAETEQTGETLREIAKLRGEREKEAFAQQGRLDVERFKAGTEEAKQEGIAGRKRREGDTDRINQIATESSDPMTVRSFISEALIDGNTFEQAAGAIASALAQDKELKGEKLRLIATRFLRDRLGGI